MPIRPPQRPFRVEEIEVMQVPKVSSISPEPTIQYKDREVIKEVEKVVYKDDPKLLEVYNKALKENGELKAALAKQPVMQEVEVQSGVVEKIKVIETKVRDLNELAIVAAASAIGGALLCYLIFK